MAPPTPPLLEQDLEGAIIMIGFIIAGLVIGALARLIKPGKQRLGLLATLLLGLAGSVIGGVVANLLGTGDIFELNVLGFIVAVVPPGALVGVAENLARRRPPPSRRVCPAAEPPAANRRPGKRPGPPGTSPVYPP